MQTQTVLIVDNSPEFRHVLKRLLRTRPDIEILGEAEDGRQALELARMLRPDVILMDVRMPGQDGLESTRKLSEELPDIKVIVLSLYDIEEYKEEAFASGAFGYVIKRNMVNELIPALQEAASGNRFPL